MVIKVDLKSENHQEFIEALKQEIPQTRLTISQNVPVCGFVGRNITPSKNRIDIAYASAVPYNYRDPGFDDAINTDSEDVCKLIMYAQYASALKYAVDKEKEDVYLMLLGGKTFNNEFSWILNAIKRELTLVHIFTVNLKIKYCQRLRSSHFHMKNMKKLLVF